MRALLRSGWTLPARVRPWSGAAVVSLGVLVVIAWLMHWDLILRGAPGLPAMKVNAALGFMECGLSLMLIGKKHKRAAATFACTAITVGVGTLLEYGLGHDIGLDQAVILDYLTPQQALPGRMSPLSAACFVFISSGLLLTVSDNPRFWRLGIAGLLAWIVGVISVVAIGGYLTGIEAAYGWGPYTRMALHTAVGMFTLSISLLAWTWETSPRHQLSLARWLPLAGSVTFMVVVALLAVISLHELRSSYELRKQMDDTLTCAQSLLGGLTDTQRGMRGYVLTGQSEALEIYRSGTDASRIRLEELRTLTQDNEPLQRLVGPLAADFDRVIAYSDRLMEIRDTQGLLAAAELETSGEGRAVVNRTRVDLQQLTDAMHRLLMERDTRTERSFHDSSRLLVIGCCLASLLLAVAHIVATREMNRRKRVEAKLFEVSTLQTAMINSANYAIFSTSVNGTVTSFNSPAERWLGYPAGSVIGKATPFLWLDPEEVTQRAAILTGELGYPVLPGFDAFVAKARLGGNDENEWTLVRKDASRFSTWVSVTALTDVKGVITGYLSVIADITERKGQEAELRLSEERFRRAFDDAPIGMALVSQEGRLLKVNHALCNMLGYSESELLARDWQSITHPEDLTKDSVLVQDVLTGLRQSYQNEKRYVHKEGRFLETMLSVSLVRDLNGSPLYFVAQIEDISERRKVARLKSEFVSTVSHELRTPLTSIRGSLGLLNGGVLGPLPEKIASLVRIAHQNSERLVLIINDILDIEKIEAGMIHLKSTVIGTADLLRQATALNQGYAEKFSVRISCETAPEQLEVVADADRLMQVLTNLLSNASKFSDAGTTVSVRAVKAGDRVRFEIEDRGIGIADDFRGRIFDKFAQAEGSNTRRFAGTGLGLSISKSLVERMGGRIWFESQVGVGTTFYVEMPGVDLGSNPDQRRVARVVEESHAAVT